jgi:hypothetical protein
MSSAGARWPLLDEALELSGMGASPLARLAATDPALAAELQGR